MECDEHPPGTSASKPWTWRNARIVAMASDGGGLATQVCVPEWQNSRTQGPIFSGFVRVCGLKAGEKFLNRLEGGCDQFNFPVRRNVEPAVNMLDRRASSGSISGSNRTLMNPNGDGSLKYVATDMGALKAGHYDLNLDMLGATVARAEVVNRYGDSYGL
jgi:hypothetical protein